MLKYIIKRILLTIPMLLVLSFIVFGMVRLIPGDPATMLIGEDVDPMFLEFEKERMGLNEPFLVQYKIFLQNILRGDMGSSHVTHKPVIEEILNRYPTTIILAVGGTLTGTILGVIMGIIAAVNHNRLADNIIMAFSMLAVSIPSFFFALILMLIFSLYLMWLPSIGLQSWKHVILPVATLGLRAIGMIARTTRSAMLDVINQDYIRTAHSKGIPKNIVIYSHALKNALIPVLTTIGLRFGGLLAGAALVETVFSIPGIGRFMIEGVSNRDYPVIQGSILVLASTFVLVNTVVDVLYAAIDPRINYD